MANSGWTSTTLGELIDAGEAMIQTGPFGSQLHSYDYRATGVPVVPTEAIGHRRLNNDVVPQIDEEKASTLARHRLQPGDLLFARRGVQATGLSAIVEPRHEGWLCGTGAILLRLLGNAVDPAYLSFYLSDPTTIAWLKGHAVGAVMPNLNETILRLLPLNYPSVSEQRRIAAILEAFDDKIELNRRMNETLETMARTLFRSWFIDFDPVHAKASGQSRNLATQTAKLFPDRFVNSPLGKVPEGWRAVPIPYAFDVNPTRQLAKGTVAPYLEMANMPTASARAIAWENREFGSGVRFVNGDTLVARITPCLENGKTAFVDFLADKQIGWGSTEYIVLRPKPPLPAVFGYFLARTDEFRAHVITNMTGTSGRQRAPAECLNKLLIVVPPASIAERFGELASAWLGTMKTNDEQSANLATARDALLPKLLRGELI